jgi:hypothetical protein
MAQIHTAPIVVSGYIQHPYVHPDTKWVSVFETDTECYTTLERALDAWPSVSAELGEGFIVRATYNPEAADDPIWPPPPDLKVRKIAIGTTIMSKLINRKAKWGLMGETGLFARQFKTINDAMKHTLHPDLTNATIVRVCTRSE